MNTQDILKRKILKIFEKDGIKRVIRLQGIEYSNAYSRFYRIWVGDYSIIWYFSKDGEEIFLKDKEAFISTLLKTSIAQNWVEDPKI